ncbi:hypothetical protein ACG74X_19435 [Marivita sp. S0852]|uniref:hypothetical protein n=1 Tax=Marivita sp. S0852 TaxID=3373893 RepID=UPI003982C281
MRSEPDDKLSYFLDAYDLKPETRRKIRKRIHQGGIGPEDPVAMMTAQDAITEERFASFMTAFDNLPRQVGKTSGAIATRISQRVIQDIDRRNQGFLNRLLTHVGGDVEAAIKQSVKSADRWVFRRAALQLALVVLLTAGMAGWVGYAFGRHDTHDIAAEYADFAARPDAATWLSLIDNTRQIDVVLYDYCHFNGPQSFDRGDGRHWCAVPLKIDKADGQVPDVEASFFKVVSILMPTGKSAWALALYGLCIGIILGLLCGQAVQLFRNRATK